MRYIWTEDTGAGLHFWNLVNQILFDNKIVIESKASNQGILDVEDGVVWKSTKLGEKYCLCSGLVASVILSFEQKGSVPINALNELE